MLWAGQQRRPSNGELSAGNGIIMTIIIINFSEAPHSRVVVECSRFIIVVGVFSLSWRVLQLEEAAAFQALQ